MRRLDFRAPILAWLLMVSVFCFMAAAAPAQTLQVTKTPGENVQISWDYPLNSGFGGFAFAQGYSLPPNSSWTIFQTLANPAARNLSFPAADRTTYYIFVAYKNNPVPEDAGGASPVITVNCTPLTRRILFWTMTVKPCR